MSGQNWQQIQSSLLQVGGGNSGGTQLLNGTTTSQTGSTTTTSTGGIYTLQLTATNIADGDAILEEISGTTQKVDIPTGAMATLGLKIEGKNEGLKFKAYNKDTEEPLLLNGLKELTIDPNAASGLASIIVVHKEGMVNF